MPKRPFRLPDYEEVPDDEPNSEMPRRDERPRRYRYSQLLPIELLMAGKVLLLAAAAVLGFLALQTDALRAAPFAGLACLCGIAARIFQAEEQFLVEQDRSGR